MTAFEARPTGGGRRIAVIAARFNEVVTSRLLQGALDGLRHHGVADEDVDVAWVPGAFEIPLVAKQLAASGNKKPVIGGGTSYDEFVLPSMGDEVIGHVSALQYSAALETPKNEAFVKKYRAKYGKVPSYYSETNYTTAQIIDEVITKAGGKYPGAEEFLKMLAAVKVDAPRGPVSFDEMRNPVQNIYIKKVEKKKMFGYDKDELWNTVIKTYPNINQFGQFKKAEFLATPVYSRDYPPCKFCN